jgi:hypothetical protein
MAETDIQRTKTESSSFFVYFHKVDELIRNNFEKSILSKLGTFTFTSDERILGSAQREPVFYMFNHTAGRFNNALGSNFGVVRRMHKNKKFAIIELGVGDQKTAQNNPPEVSRFSFEGEQIPVVKFWYSLDFEFVASENEEYAQKLENIMHSGPQIKYRYPYSFDPQQRFVVVGGSEGFIICDTRKGVAYCNHVFNTTTPIETHIKENTSSSTPCPHCEFYLV